MKSLSAVVFASALIVGLHAQAPQRRIPLNGADPEVSPDGRQILFVSERGGQGQIYVMNADGSQPRQLTNEAGGALSPAWSPDGTRMAFIRRDGQITHLCIMNLDGTGLRRVENSDNAWSPHWSPDGTRLAFTTVGSPARTVFTMDLAGGGKTMISPADGFDLGPKWSPDGTQLLVTALSRGATPSSASQRLVLMKADGTNRREATRGTTRQTGAAWSPDGRSIALTTVVLGDNGQATDSFIHLVNVATGEERRLGTHPVASFDEAPSWFPDGKRLAIQRQQDGAWNVFVMDLDGRVMAQLTK